MLIIVIKVMERRANLLPFKEPHSALSVHAWSGSGSSHRERQTVMCQGNSPWSDPYLQIMRMSN